MYITSVKYLQTIGRKGAKNFEQLKAELIKPVCTMYNSETKLHNEASKLSIDGILLQRPKNRSTPWRPMEY